MKSKDYRPAYGSPISFKSGANTHIAVLKTDGLVILDAQDGKTLAFEKWETSYRTNASTPIIKGDKIFISTGYRRGCALFQWNGKFLRKIYENKNLSTHMNHAIRQEIISTDSMEMCTWPDPKTLPVSNFPTARAVAGYRSWSAGWLPIVAGTACSLGQRGECVIAKVNPNRFEVLNREQIIGGKTWTMPVLANGLFYARNARGDLFCLKL